MGEVRVKVKLTNEIDEILVNRGLLNPTLLRVYETHALVDTGATRLVVPIDVVQHLGIKIKNQQIAKYADGREELVGITALLRIELLSFRTIQPALVAGDEVLIGQTVLEDLDLLVDCKNERLVTKLENAD